MCIVHRIISDPNTGLKAAIRFEFPPKKGITLSTQALLNGRPLVLEANTSTTLTFAEKPATKARRESFTERARRLENARLTGSAPLPGVEEHCFSPQSSAEREPMRFVDDGSYEKGTRYQCSEHHRGRKPEYKNKTAPRISTMMPALVCDLHL